MTEHNVVRRIDALKALAVMEAWDDEQLHQFRVQLRALLATLPLLEIASPHRLSIRGELKAILQGYNQCRDRDVFGQYLDTVPGGRKWLRRLSRQAVPRIKLDTKRFAELMIEAEALASRWQAYASHCDWSALLALHRHLYCDLIHVRLAKAQAKPCRGLHRLRVAVKRLRYLVELLMAPEGEWPERLPQIKRWQDKLGTYADLTALQQWLKQPGGGKVRRRIKARRLALQAELLAELPQLATLIEALAGLPVVASMEGPKE